MNPGVPKNLSFRLESVVAKKGGRIGRIKPTPEGVYVGLPMMVLGMATQQNTYYDPQSVMNQFVNPESNFSVRMRNQAVYGEFGHPAFPNTMSDSEKIQRLTTVDEKNTSHLFTSFYTDKPSPDGTVILRGDVKPTGPYGSVFKESLDDPIVNTAFSLRAYVDTNIRPDGLKFRTVRSLVTFDTVGASGFRDSTKANALGLESFSGDRFEDVEINVLQNGNLMIDQIALETFSNTELNEIFGTSDLSRIVQSRTFVEADPSLHQRFPNLYRASVLDDFFREIKR